MTWFQALFLALLQGLTEFLPVSSSGHLAIAQTLMPGFQQPGIAYDIILHVGTLGSVFIFFWNDLKVLAGLKSDIPSVFSGREENILVSILIASVPTGIIGVMIKLYAEETFEGLFHNLAAVGLALLVTGVVLMLAGTIESKDKIDTQKINYKQALLIGLAQGMAIMPGISRSGSTVATGLFVKLDRQTAFAFSFIVSIPAILGATAIEAKDIFSAVSPSSGEMAMYLVGGALACASGYFALKLFAKVVKTINFTGFAYYCFFVGIAALVFGLFL